MNESKKSILLIFKNGGSTILIEVLIIKEVFIENEHWSGIGVSFVGWK